MKEMHSNPKVVPIRISWLMHPVARFVLWLAIAGGCTFWVGDMMVRGRLGRWDRAEMEVALLFLFFLFLALYFIWWIYFGSKEENLSELLNKSQDALKLSSDYLHGCGVIKSLHVADENYRKALGGFMQVAKGSTCGETCFKCAAVLEKLTEPEGFSVNPETKFSDRSLVAATFLRAALLGNRTSQLKVAQLYQEGVGFFRDVTEAYAWFNICAAHGNLEAERCRELLATSLSQAEIAKAQQRSQELFAMVNGRN